MAVTTAARRTPYEARQWRRSCCGPIDEGRGNPLGRGEDGRLRAQGECPGSEDSDSTASDTAVAVTSGHGAVRPRRPTAGRDVGSTDPEVPQGPCATARRAPLRLVALKELRPARGVGRMADSDRCEDRNPDRIRYLVTFPAARRPSGRSPAIRQSDQRAGHCARSIQPSASIRAATACSGTDRRLEQFSDHMLDGLLPITNIRR